MSPSLKFALRFAAGFAVVLIAGNLLTEWLNLRFVFAGTRQHMHVFHHYRADPEPTDVVFFGTSATANGIVTKIAEESLTGELGRPARAWNLALPGGNPLPTPALIEQFFNGDRKPQVLVVEGTPGFWNENRKGQHSFAYWRWFAPISDVLKTAGDYDWQYTETGINRLAQGVETVWKLPSFAISRGARRHFAEAKRRRGGEYSLEMVRVSEGGGKPVADDPVGRPPVGINPLKFGQLFTSTLEDTVTYCRERNIQLVLVNIPARTDVMPNYADGEYDQFQSWMKAKSRELGFLYYDLNVPSWIDPNEHFRGFIHLNPVGARNFTRRFSQQVVAPLLRGEEPPNEAVLTATKEQAAAPDAHLVVEQPADSAAYASSLN